MHSNAQKPGGLVHAIPTKRRIGDGNGFHIQVAIGGTTWEIPIAVFAKEARTELDTRHSEHAL
jgi:hypothetical protein